MSTFFDGHSDDNDGAFIEIRFNDILPDKHPARFIKEFIEILDISKFEEKYNVGEGKSGRPPKEIRMMLGVILYAIYSRIYSARKMEVATYTIADFWIFTHKRKISHDTISKFIITHEKDIVAVFLETITLAESNHLLDFKALFEDGFPMQANASKSRNRTLKGLDKRKVKFREILKTILIKLKDEDSGEVRKNLEIQKKKAIKEIVKIHVLKKKLNKRIEVHSQKDCTSEIKRRIERTTINLTDSDSELGQNKNKGYDNQYTKITALDGKADILIESRINGNCDESHIISRLTRDANLNCSKDYSTIVADAGFISFGTAVQFEANNWKLVGPTKEQSHKERKSDYYKNKVYFTFNEDQLHLKCSQGKTLDKVQISHDSKHGKIVYRFSNKEVCGICPRLENCSNSKKNFKQVKIDARFPVRQRVLDRYSSKEGKNLYKKRSHVAETFQGDLKKNGSFKQLFRRGIDKVRTDSKLHDIVWNLRRIFNSVEDEIVWT